MSAYALLWVAIIVAAAITYLTKLAGHLVPESLLAHPMVQRMSGYVTIALLAALMATQAFTTGSSVVADARVVAVIVAAVLLRFKAPFIVVVAAAAAVAAGLRALGWA